MEKLKKSEIRILIRTLKSKGYVVYEKPYQLNIVGRRTDTTKPNSFDDWIYIFYKNNDNDWEGWKAKATTDAGTYWLLNPLQSTGTALLKAGQYVDAYAIGKHLGKYDALTQKLKPVVVVRDYNRNNILDFNNGKEESGYFGINLHHADSSGTTTIINKYSAGCQVFSNIDDFNKFMDMAYKHKDLYGNIFTYTLIDERSYNRRRRRRFLVWGVMTLAVVGGIILLKKYAKNG
jgi:hypothetical protein